MDNHQPAPLSLTVSLTYSGTELWRMSTPLPTSGPHLSSEMAQMFSSMPTSDIGSILRQSMMDLDLKRIEEQAFDALEWGDGNQSPVMIALSIMRQNIIGILKGVDNGDQPEQNEDRG
jgi:hypothetical protein